MPLIQPEDPLVDLKIKLPSAELADLQLYAASISSSESYVIRQALKTLTADEDFQTWKQRHAGKSAQPVAVGSKKRNTKESTEAA